jgi:hypothetical protein
MNNSSLLFAMRFIRMSWLAKAIIDFIQIAPQSILSLAQESSILK